MLSATSFCVRPSCAARVRSTFETISGTFDHLVNVDVHRARNFRNPLRDLFRDQIILCRVRVGADHLNINRSGQSEIQDLTHNVGGLEKECQRRIFAAELLPHFTNVIPRGAMFSRPQRNQNLTIERSDNAAVAGGDVQPAIRETNVVENVRQFLFRNDAADRVFHLREILFGLFHARAGGRGHAVESARHPL